MDTNDQTTQALLKEAWAILADELQGEFTEEHQDVIDETQVEKWLLSKDTHVMTLSYRSGHIISTAKVSQKPLFNESSKNPLVTRAMELMIRS